MFNPWKILSQEELYKEWEHLTPINYRQCNESDGNKLILVLI